MSDTAFYRAQGHVALPLFDRALVEAAQADIAEHIDRLSHAMYLPFDRSCPDAPLAERLDRIYAHDRSQANLLRVAICTDAHRGPRLQAIANDPRLHAEAERIGERALAGKVVRVRASIASFPEHRHAWHSDVARDDGTSCGQVWTTAWIPLCDAGPGNGGLEIIPGRQHAPLASETDDGLRITEEAIAGLPRLQPECPAGTVLFLDRFTPHRTLPAGKARFALVVWMKAA
ncbi:hypothetical protein CAP40_16020 [Sphingomonas sp. IBVSS2]|uniref:phytanoyl-CoA dioxygenase family protein n=1 Tax=Sphingomonas sp. IBVSS2 TaxID=1985172 RepID=UPI000A2D547F|nr:phytanoyl-CoA dioxygenase family protein [Sphingomonas sp. IBVSS2]OSZ64194.1 hypothetical protein CAP40_16020 [Sphingomonas sp. IBVSS2]